MAKFFIHHPVFAIVVSLVILLAGGVSIPALPIAQYPEICPPVIQVTTVYTGANAQTVEETVATPIEQQVNGAEGMLYMRSTCTNQGYYTLQVTFDLSRDQDMAMVDVQNRINQAAATLPSEVNQVGITVAKQSTQNLLYLCIYSEDKSRDSLFLSNYTTINILDQIKRISGVGACNIMCGQRDYAMRMWLQPDKMQKYNITGDDVAAAISSQSQQAASGSIGLPPQPPGQQFQYPVNVKGRLTDPKEFENVILRVNSDGGFLRVKDIADTELGASDYSSEGLRLGEPAVIIGVYQLPDANGVDLAEKIKAKMDELSANFPSGVNYEVTYDSTIFVVKSIEEVVDTLFEAIVLVLIVVFIFLGNVRATLIPILAVPVSLVGTFAGFAVLGFSINLLTMFGLVLAVGIVVDDAIVVVEAVELHIEHGLTPLEATEKAMDEVSGPVVAIALVLCAVFVPVAFMGGLTGELYRQFAVTLAVSVVLSAVVALTLTPALSAMILRPRGKGLWGPFGWIINGFNKCFEWATAVYIFLVKKAIHWVPVTLVFIGGLYYGVFYLFTHTPTGFVPTEDTGIVSVSVTLPSGASLERTKEVVDEIEGDLRKLKPVKCTMSLVGFNVLQSTQTSDAGCIILSLKDWSERKDPKEFSDAIEMAINMKYAGYEKAMVQAFLMPAIPGLGNNSGISMQLQDRAGNTVDQLSEATNKYLAAANAKQDTFLAVYTMFKPSIPIIKVDVDRDKLMKLGVPVSSAFMGMQINLGGFYVNQFNEFGRTWRVYLQAASKYRRTASDIGQIYVRGANGMVPLSTVTTITETTGPDTLIRYNLYRTAELVAMTIPGVSSGQGMEALENLAKTDLEQGYGYEWTGMSYQEKLASGQTAQILALGLVFVFLFLAAQYESWGVPFSVLAGMPVVVLGAIVGITVAGMDLNIYVQIGILTLIGLSAKNAILIVEYAKAYYEDGVPLVQASVDAAKLRFRPILMTSFAFIMGVVPLARATGASAVCRQALGISVMSGMLAASIIGVVFIPAFYVYVQWVINKVSGESKKVLEARARREALAAAGASGNAASAAEPVASAEPAAAPAAEPAVDGGDAGDKAEPAEKADTAASAEPKA